jgi:membrane protein implicated in regulation of membrane protease activity
MSTSLIFSTVGSIGIFVLFLGYYLAKDWRNRKTGEVSDYNSPIGKQAHIIEILPSEEEGIFYYQIKVGGEFWKAKSNKLLQLNDKCEIKKQEQLILIIE